MEILYPIQIAILRKNIHALIINIIIVPPAFIIVVTIISVIVTCNMYDIHTIVYMCKREHAYVHEELFR